MPNEKPKSNESTEKPGDEVILGKKFPGEKFSTVRDAKEAAELAAEDQLRAQHPQAMPLSVYFSHKRIHDPMVQSMMEAYTKVRTATLETFDSIFKAF